MNWVSVKDKLPSIYKTYGISDEVLVTDGKNKWLEVYDAEGNWTEHSLWDIDTEITHWMAIELPGQEI